MTEPDTIRIWPPLDMDEPTNRWLLGEEPAPLPPRPRPWWDLRRHEAIVETHFRGDRLLAIRAWTEDGLDRKLERREQARRRIEARLARLAQRRDSA